MAKLSYLNSSLLFCQFAKSPFHSARSDSLNYEVFVSAMVFTCFVPFVALSVGISVDCRTLTKLLNVTTETCLEFRFVVLVLIFLHFNQFRLPECAFKPSHA